MSDGPFPPGRGLAKAGIHALAVLADESRTRSPSRAFSRRILNEPVADIVQCGELGYLAPSADGDLKWVSLVDRVPTDARAFTDVWRTFATPSGVFFQSEQLIPVRGFDTYCRPVFSGNLRFELKIAV